jgi:hypothetical protein
MSAVVELYGLVVESDLPLGAPRLADRRLADVRVHAGARPPGAEAWDRAPVRPFFVSEPSPGASPALVADRPGSGGIIRLTYHEGIRFHVRADGAEVWCDWDPPLTADDAATFLLGPVLGLVLRRRGVLALHASAVVIDGAAWAFLGAGGAGKSSLAAAFARTGVTVLTDDVLAIRAVDGRYRAWPAYDHLRLWSDSPALPRGMAESLPALSATWEKRAFRMEGPPQGREPVPFAGWFLIDREDGATRPVIERLSGATALSSLVALSYVNYLLDTADRAAELTALGTASVGLRAHRLLVGEGPEGLTATVTSPQ